MIKEELKNQIKSAVTPEACKLLKDTILKTAKTTIGKYQMTSNIFDHLQVKRKRKQRKHYQYG